MTKESQNAAVQELLNQSLVYRKVAHLRNGIPDAPTGVNVQDFIEAEARVLPPPAPAPTPPPPVAPQPPAVVETKRSSWAKKLAPWLVGAAGATGLGAGSAAWLMRPDTPQPEPPAVVKPQPTGDLLEYLRKEGYHLPPSEGVEP